MRRPIRAQLLTAILVPTLASASLFQPLLEAFGNQETLPGPILNFTSPNAIDSEQIPQRGGARSPSEIFKRQANSQGGCPVGYSNCANLGAANLCCINTAQCTPDQAGYVACCPIGAACTGRITGVITAGTIPTAPATAATTAIGGATTSIGGATTSIGGVTTGAATTATPTTTAGNGLVIASGTATANNGGFIIAAGTTVASPGAGGRSAHLPSGFEVLLGALGLLGLL